MKLDQSLENIETSVIHMGELVLKQYNKVIQLLETKDKDIAVYIIKKDEFVNRYEEDINNQAIAQFALLSPVATDLRRVLTAIKIASELERIGDYAKSFASFIVKDRDIEEEEVIQLTIDMVRTVVELLKESIQSYEEGNLDLAFSIPEKSSQFDEMTKQFRQTLIKTDTISKKQVVYLSGLLRNVTRATDHTVNICEHVVYLKKGIHYDFN